MKKKGVSVLVFGSRREGARTAAEMVAREVRKKPRLRLGLATGKTMIPVYHELVKLHRSGGVDFSKVKFTSLDEYVGSDKMKKYLWKHFFGKVEISETNVNLLNGRARNLRAECERYERATRGVDLQILGIGRNGHIGFNEPGSDFKSRTGRVELTKSTLKDNGLVRANALSMGLGTILKSKKILLVAWGGKKKKAVAGALGKRTGDVPASALQLGKDVTFILDKRAASKLEQ